MITDFFNRDLVISLEIRFCFKPLHEAAAVKDKAVFWNAEYQVCLLYTSCAFPMDTIPCWKGTGPI